MVVCPCWPHGRTRRPTSSPLLFTGLKAVPDTRSAHTRQTREAPRRPRREIPDARKAYSRFTPGSDGPTRTFPGRAALQAPEHPSSPLFPRAPFGRTSRHQLHPLPTLGHLLLLRALVARLACRALLETDSLDRVAGPVRRDAHRLQLGRLHGPYVRPSALALGRRRALGLRRIRQSVHAARRLGMAVLHEGAPAQRRGEALGLAGSDGHRRARLSDDLRLALRL